MKFLKTIINRTTFMILAVLVEFAIIFAIFSWFRDLAGWIDIILRIMAVLIILIIINHSQHLSSDLLWIVVIFLFPIPGTIVYLFFGADLLTSRTYRALKEETSVAEKYYSQDEKIEKDLWK